MRSDRLVSMMLLLQARSRRSARELAASLEVSTRTVYRDVDALSASGVPIYAERGSNGGIILADGYRQAIAQFNADELHALFASAIDPLSDLGVSAHQRALHKLEGALPDLQRRAAQKARERVLLDHNKWYRSQQPSSLLSLLRHAVWDERQVRIEYRDRTGSTTSRVIDPLGLVSKAGIWYVIGRIDGGEMRTFRAERIAGAEQLVSKFDRPPEFDLEQYWLSSKAPFERPSETYETTLEVNNDVFGIVVSFWEADVLEQGEFGKRIRVRFPSREAALGQIAGWGARMRILEPAELRDAVISLARELLDAYAST